MNTEEQTGTELNREAALVNFKSKAKLEALRFAPNRKIVAGLAAHGSMPYEQSMSAKEIVVAAEEIYQWLTKDL
jgi:hypothetical protein